MSEVFRMHPLDEMLCRAVFRQSWNHCSPNLSIFQPVIITNTVRYSVGK